MAPPNKFPKPGAVLPASQARRARSRQSQQALPLNPLPRPTSASPRTYPPIFAGRNEKPVSNCAASSVWDVEDKVWEAMSAADEMLTGEGPSAGENQTPVDVAPSPAAAVLSIYGAKKGDAKLPRAAKQGDSDSDFVAPKAARRPLVRAVCPYSSAKFRRRRLSQGQSCLPRPHDSSESPAKGTQVEFQGQKDAIPAAPDIVDVGSDVECGRTPISLRTPSPVLPQSTIGASRLFQASCPSVREAPISEHSSSEHSTSTAKPFGVSRKRRRSFQPMKWSDDEADVDSDRKRGRSLGASSEEDDDLLRRPQRRSGRLRRADTSHEDSRKSGQGSDLEGSPPLTALSAGIEMPVHKRVRRSTIHIRDKNSSEDPLNTIRENAFHGTDSPPERDKPPASVQVISLDESTDGDKRSSVDSDGSVAQRTPNVVSASASVLGTKRTKLATPSRQRLPRSALQIDPRRERGLHAPLARDLRRGRIDLAACRGAEDWFTESMRRSTPNLSFEERGSSLLDRKAGEPVLVHTESRPIPDPSMKRSVGDGPVVFMKHRTRSEPKWTGHEDGSGCDEWMNEREIGDFSDFDDAAPKPGTRTARGRHFSSERKRPIRNECRPQRSGVVVAEQSALKGGVHGEVLIGSEDDRPGDSHDFDKDGTDKDNCQGALLDHGAPEVIPVFESDVEHGLGPGGAQEQEETYMEKPVFDIRLVLCRPGETVQQMLNRVGLDEAMNQIFDAQIAGRRVIGAAELGISSDVDDGSSAPGRSSAAEKFHHCAGSSSKKYTFEDARARLSGANEARYTQRGAKRGGRRSRGGSNNYSWKKSSRRR